MREQRCENCRFWSSNKEINEPDDEEDGECRRFPPVLLNDDDVFKDESWGWPITVTINWCGEWKAADAEKVEVYSKVMQKSISLLCLSKGTLNSIRLRYDVQPDEKHLPQKIELIGDLISLTANRLLEIRNFGMVALEEVREKLAILGLKLKGD